ncbi:hypothetical protein PMAYCL1PPCAC_04386, partial [Pristionchus mayeri]
SQSHSEDESLARAPPSRLLPRHPGSLQAREVLQTEVRHGGRGGPHLRRLSTAPCPEPHQRLRFQAASPRCLRQAASLLLRVLHQNLHRCPDSLPGGLPVSAARSLHLHLPPPITKG